MIFDSRWLISWVASLFYSSSTACSITHWCCVVSPEKNVAGFTTSSPLWDMLVSRSLSMLSVIQSGRSCRTDLEMTPFSAFGNLCFRVVRLSLGELCRISIYRLPLIQFYFQGITVVVFDGLWINMHFKVTIPQRFHDTLRCWIFYHFQNYIILINRAAFKNRVSRQNHVPLKINSEVSLVLIIVQDQPGKGNRGNIDLNGLSKNTSSSLFPKHLEPYETNLTCAELAFNRNLPFPPSWGTQNSRRSKLDLREKHHIIMRRPCHITIFLVRH